MVVQVSVPFLPFKDHLVTWSILKKDVDCLILIPVANNKKTHTWLPLHFPSLTTVTFTSQLVYCHIFFCKWPCSKTFFDVPWLHCRNPTWPMIFGLVHYIPWDRVPHERVGPGNKTSHDSQLKSLVMKLMLLCSDTQPAHTYLLALWYWADSKKMGTALSGVSGNEADNATDLYGTPYHVMLGSLTLHTWQYPRSSN